MFNRKITVRALIFLVVIAIFGESLKEANAMGKHSHIEPIKNFFRVEKVKLSKESRLSLSTGLLSSVLGRVERCDSFTGTHAGNQLLIQAGAEGGDGHYSHTLVYRFGEDSYQMGGKLKSFNVETSKNGDFKVKLPELNESVPYVNQTFTLITTDRAGNSVQNTQIFAISRPIILTKSTDPEATKYNCVETLPPTAAPIGRLSNGSTLNSLVEVNQSVYNSLIEKKGSQFGVYLSPVVGVLGGFVSLFSFNYRYFTEISKQHSETIEVKHKIALEPGQFLDVYIQPTRTITAYDLDLVGVCGERKAYPGAYLFQNWGFSYPVKTVVAGESPKFEVIGAPPQNTCSEKPELKEPMMTISDSDLPTQSYL